MSEKRLWHVKEKTCLLDWWTKFGIRIALSYVLFHKLESLDWWLVERFILL